MKPNRTPKLYWIGLLVILLLTNSCQQSPPTIPENTDWEGYLGGASTNQYSSLDQINTKNVTNLKVAWTYNTGDADTSNRTQIQCNPIIIDGVLYGSSAKLKFFALDAATGEELWVFDPFEGNYQQFGMGVNRGVAYWSDGIEKRLLVTASSFLYAIDAKTGQLDTSFGIDGKADLHDGLGERAKDFFVVSNTPGVVYKDLLISDFGATVKS